MGLQFRPRRPLLLLATGAATPSTGVHVARRRAEHDAWQAVAPDTGVQAPEPPASVAAPPHLEMMDELERLARLRESGALTDDEFTAAKTRALGL